MFFPDLSFPPLPPKPNLFWWSLLLLQQARLSPSYAPHHVWVWRVGRLAWIYRLLWTCKLSLFLAHLWTSLRVIFCSLCFLSSLRGTGNCYSAASQVHEYLCLSESSSRRYDQTGFTVLLGTIIAFKRLLFEGFFPVLWALVISFPVRYSTAIVSLGLFLATK